MDTTVNPTQQDGANGSGVNVVKRINVSALNDQQHEGILLEKVLKVFTIETRQDMQKRIKELKAVEDAFEADARKEYLTLNEKAESRIQKEWAKDKTVAALITALKVFGTHTTKAELVTQVRLVNYQRNTVYSEPLWAVGRRGWGRYEVDLNMEIAGCDVEVNRFFKLDDELTTALAAWKRTVAEGTKMLENIALLEQELKDLPEKAASLEAQVLRQQIAGDAKFGGKMTALLDSARARSSGGLMRLL